MTGIYRGIRLQSASLMSANNSCGDFGVHDIASFWWILPRHHLECSATSDLSWGVLKTVCKINRCKKTRQTTYLKICLLNSCSLEVQMETRGLGWLHTAQFQQFHGSGTQETLVCHQFGGIYGVLKTNHWTAADWGALRWINRPQWALNENYLSYVWPRWLKSTLASDTYVTFALSDTKYVNLVMRSNVKACQS